MKHIASFLAIITFVCSPFFGVSLTQAHTISNEPSGFNPGSLISDSDFLRADSMSAGEINNFLASKGSWLANYVIPEYMEVPYFCKNDQGGNEIRSVSVRQWHVNNFPLYGMTVATLLADRAVANAINPQVMLVLLERESSAITRAAPSSSMTQTWPLFYAFDETMASYNYSCATAQQKAIDFGGLGQQIAYGTYGIKKNYTDSSDWNSPITIDGSTFTPQSRATRALYRYTPHIHNGNHNFWYLFMIWFASISPPAYAPALKAGPDGSVYFIDSGKRWPLRNMAVFDDWGFNRSAIAVVSDDTLAAWPVGTIVTNLVVGSDGTVYRIDHGKRRIVSSGRVFEASGLSWANVSNIDSSILSQLPYGMPMYELLRNTGSDTVSIYTRSQGYPIPFEIFAAWGFAWDDVGEVPYYASNQYPTTRNLDRLAMTPDGTVYLMDRGLKYAIPGSVWGAWAFSGSKITATEYEFMNTFPTARNLTTLALAPDGNVYLIEGGKKRPVTGTGFRRNGYSWGNVVPLSANLLNTLATGTTVN